MHSGAANNIVTTRDTQGDRGTAVNTGTAPAPIPGCDAKKGTFVAKCDSWDSLNADSLNASTVAVDRPVCIKLEPTPGAARRAEMVLKRQGFLR
jgi:hypothetical protein